QREAIWQEHHDRMTAIESDYFAKKSEMEAAAAMGSISELGNALTGMLDKSSGAYAVALAMQKSYSIFSSLMAAKTAYAQAFADPSAMTVPQKIMGALAVAAPMASALSSLMSIQTDIKGSYANGGYTGHGGKYDPAGIVHKGEGVLTQEEIKALGGPQGFEELRKSIRRGYSAGGLVADTHRVGMGAVNAIGAGRSGNVVVQPQININVPPGYTAEKRQDSNGVVTVDIVRKIAREEAKAPWDRLGDFNSYEQKQIKRYTTATPKK